MSGLEREKKAKTFLGALLAIGGLAYNIEWSTIVQNYPQVVSGLVAIIGTYLSSTGPSVKK
jgi:hypothetical protein